MKYQKTNKYFNVICKYNGITFHSKKEKDYYLKLKMLEKAGKIKDLKLQVPFLLLNTIKYKNKTYSKVQYYADFQYLDVETGKIKIIDVKSEITKKDKVYRLKIKMLLNKYPNIDFEEII